MIGTLGNIVFVVSSERILTFRDLSRNSGPRYEEHAVIGKKPVLELVGPSLDTMSLRIRLDSSHNVDPDEEADKMREAMNAGEVLPFVIGNKYFGDFAIMTIAENSRNFDNKGRLLLSEITLSLKEVRP